MKKKIISLIMVMALVLSLSAINIAAAYEAKKPTVTVESAEAKKGDEVSLKVKLDGNTGIWGMDINISYDKTALTLLSVDNGSFFKDSEWTPGKLDSVPYILSYEANGFEDIKTQSGILAVLNFKVSDNAEPSAYSVNVSYNAGSCINAAAEDVDINMISGSITVKGSEPVHTHSLTKVAAKAVTCTEDGNKEYFVCDGCSKWFEDEAAATEITDHDSVVIKAKGHTPSDWNVDKEATESEKGSKHKECTVCKKILETAEIPVLEPTKPTDDPTKPTDDPTKPTDDPTKPTDKPTQPATKTTTGTSSVQTTPKSNGKSGVVNTGDGSMVFLFAVVMIGGCVSAYLINNYRKKKTSK
ncbi:MAG: cohesin domain-containing protein [Acutalibacteraceae bacterium]